MLTNRSELVRLVEDRNGDGRADASSVFATGFNESVSGTAAGVLARNGQVWFASVPDLWRLTGTNSVAAQKTRLHTGYGVHIGVTGHDLHGLILGPDGKLYFSSGDRGFVVTNKEGRVLNFPDTGGVLRCDPDGSNLEVFAYGLRNPQELAFDAFGNLFTADNDTAGEDKSRLIHVVEGADYGWRCSYQHMAGFGPWVQENVWRGNIDDVLPWSGEVAQGPAGLAFYPGTGLPESFKDHFLVCDFPGGIWSFDVKTKGASFELVKKEKFLWNLWPTDVTFGPDGAVYVSDWVAGWQMPDKGRIYRITDPAQTGNPELATVKKMLNDGLSGKSATELVELLGHSDQRVRLQAQSRLIDLHSVQDLISVLAMERPVLVKIHALWALDQLARTDPAMAVPAAQAMLSQLASPDSDVRAQAVKMIGNRRAAAASAKLVPLLKDPSARVRFETAQSLGKLSDKSAIDPILAFLRDNNDQDAYLSHAGVMALLQLADANILANAARDSSAAIRRAVLLVMRRQQNPAIARFLNDFEPRIVYEAARAINDVPITDAMPELATWLTKVDCPTNILSRAINANFRIGKEPNAKVLAVFARRVDMPEALRSEALGALADWANPSPIDRVMGLSRPLPRRTLVHAQRAFLAVAGDIFAGRSTPVQLAAIKTATSLKTKEVAQRLFEKFQSAETAVDLRREIPSL
ncbi:MAG: HEAT repeat domain-containing protein, partial [Opitutaceae bacterium]|nr:HEAT repeat domain-containing protein [Verrucomicrobiales bacterium]